ncbi:hypothetical protein GCM10023231_40540 [Olivibacter ginsenosidimutans]|uniref:DUF4377 domain-containing protein n=1 Tax=Olivibacter ginsenosidimutans TaxID=1176537 RepID=A0ABP9CDJ0_9SPHI
MDKWIMTKTGCFLLLVSLIFSALHAQTKDTLTLQQAFKQSADSTLILTEKSGWSLGNTNALVLSKKGDTVACYQYKLVPPQQSSLKRIPKQLAAILNEQYHAAAKDSLRLNAYFKVYPLDVDRAQVFWIHIMKLEPWQLKDDRAEGEGCPVVDSADRPRHIFDGVTYTLYLITSDESQELQFYEPAFYEKECPGRASRQKMLEILSTFKSIFNKKSRI